MGCFPCVVIGARGFGPIAPIIPAVFTAGFEQACDSNVCTARKTNIGPVDPANFIGVAMDVENGFFGIGGIDQGVALGFNVSKTRSDQEQAIRVAHPLGKLGVYAHIQVARKAEMAIVHVVLTAKPDRDGETHMRCEIF